MKGLGSTDTIRQQQIGQFNQPDDGKMPFTHVNDQKVNDVDAKKKPSIFVGGEKILTLEKGMRAKVPELFDFDAGAKVKPRVKVEKTADADKEKLQASRNKIEKTETPDSPDNLVVNEWI